MMSSRVGSSRRARAGLLIGSLAAIFGGSELLLRWLDLPRFDACADTADYAIPDPQLGFAARPGSNMRGIVLNEAGLRGPILAEPKPRDHFRILYLGDSTCWGVGVPLDATFAARTTERLAATHPDRRFEFLIGAFPGYSTYHSRILLERLLPMQPDLVVFYVGARNDPWRARYFPDAEISRRRARLQAAWHQLRLLRLVEAAADRSYRSLFRKLRPASTRARVPPDAFRENLQRMARRLEEAGVPGLIVLPPFSKEFADKLPLALEYREILEEVGRRYRLPTVALQTAFDAEKPRRVYFGDMYHFAGRGHEIASREIHRAIAEHPHLHERRDVQPSATIPGGTGGS